MILPMNSCILSMFTGGRVAVMFVMFAVVEAAMLAEMVAMLRHGLGILAEILVLDRMAVPASIIISARLNHVLRHFSRVNPH